MVEVRALLSGRRTRPTVSVWRQPPLAQPVMIGLRAQLGAVTHFGEHRIPLACAVLAKVVVAAERAHNRRIWRAVPDGPAASPAAV